MNVLVVGAGVSGVAASKFLLKSKHRVSLSDQIDRPLPGELVPFREHLTWVPGRQDVELLQGIDQVVVSPGVPLSCDLLVEARERNLPVTAEIDLALKEYRGAVVGITGTNGKSTTCAMITHALKRASRSAVACGNFGVPPTALLYDAKHFDYWVMELSSYQLELCQRLKPKASVFTSFSPDHLARHGTLSNYFAIKWRLIDTTVPGGLVAMPDEVLQESRKLGLHVPRVVTLTVIGKDLRHKPNLAFLRTKHDRVNAQFAAAVVSHLCGISTTDAVVYLSDFKTLPHRFESFAKIGGYAVIDDSKSTNVDAVLCALENIEGNCWLLLGGQGKGESFKPIAQYRDKIEHVFCFGQSGPTIAQELRMDFAPTLFPTLGALLQTGLPQAIARHRGPILLSPGCASFDEFKSFADRGEFFKKAILSNPKGAWKSVPIL